MPQTPTINGVCNGHSIGAMGEAMGETMKLRGHALRNAHLREQSLKRSKDAPPLAQAIVNIRAGVLQMTRLEFARASGMSRGVLRDLELGVHRPTRQTLQQFVDFCCGHDVAADVVEN